jgi:hypothetical protein
MKRSNSHKAPALPTIVVLCICLSACGGSSHGAGSPSRSSSAIASPSAVPTSPSITGDYDGDDEKASKHSSDGDNDDSTPKDRDNDSDNSSGSYFDGDDKSVRGLGHAASAADGKTIERLVKRYFAVAVAEDGKTACSMISSGIAKSIPETLGGGAGPLYARGATTCAAVMSKTFAHYHRQLAAHAPTLEVSAVRVDGNDGLAVLAFKALPGRQLRVARDGGVWRVGALLDLELP